MNELVYNLGWGKVGCLIQASHKYRNNFLMEISCSHNWQHTSQVPLRRAGTREEGLILLGAAMGARAYISSPWFWSCSPLCTGCLFQGEITNARSHRVNKMDPRHILCSPYECIPGDTVLYMKKDCDWANWSVEIDAMAWAGRWFIIFMLQQGWLIYTGPGGADGRETDQQ